MSDEANDMIDLGNNFKVHKLNFGKKSKEAAKPVEDPAPVKEAAKLVEKPATTRTAPAPKPKAATRAKAAKPGKQSKKLLNPRVDVEVIEALRAWSAKSGLRYDSALFQSLEDHGDEVVKVLAAKQKELAEFGIAPPKRTNRAEQLAIRVNPNLEAKFMSAVESAGVSKAAMLQALLRAFLADQDL